MRIAAFLGAVALCCATLRVSAHELLPQELVDYMAAHPDATMEDLERFLATASGSLLEEGRTLEDVRDTVYVARVGFWENAAAFIRLGFKHILEGTDHILFVLSLLLTFETLRRTLKSVTAFTVAHSITLILAGSGILTLGTRLVESVVALSIAAVAIGTVFLRRFRFFAAMESKVAMVFVFGLFHGLGFAGLLRTLPIPEGRFVSSLLFFNVGIELGQILVIALALPCIFAFRRKPWYPLAVRILAAIIGALALGWFARRAFGVDLTPWAA